MDLKYPIGKFSYTESLSPSERQQKIDEIAKLPEELATAVTGLSGEQIDTPYRDGGWTVRQVVHHLADSHINSYVRFRLALTEEAPGITTYKVADWAELTDARSADIGISLNLLSALHQRWTILLKSMTDDDFTRSVTHPTQGLQGLDRYLALYAWHGRHHTAHITSLRERNGW